MSTDRTYEEHHVQTDVFCSSVGTCQHLENKPSDGHRDAIGVMLSLCSEAFMC